MKRPNDRPKFAHRVSGPSQTSKTNPSDVMVSIVENSDEDWSFELGRAQFLTRCDPWRSERQLRVMGGSERWVPSSSATPLEVDVLRRAGLVRQEPNQTFSSRIALPVMPLL